MQRLQLVSRSSRAAFKFVHTVKIQGRIIFGGGTPVVVSGSRKNINRNFFHSRLWGPPGTAQIAQRSILLANWVPGMSL